MSQLAASATYQPILVFGIAGVIYYLLTLVDHLDLPPARAALQPLPGGGALAPEGL